MDDADMNAVEAVAESGPRYRKPGTMTTAASPDPFLEPFRDMESWPDIALRGQAASCTKGRDKRQTHGVRTETTAALSTIYYPHAFTYNPYHHLSRHRHINLE